jgi:hypothetical protein
LPRRSFEDCIHLKEAFEYLLDVRIAFEDAIGKDARHANRFWQAIGPLAFRDASGRTISWHPLQGEPLSTSVVVARMAGLGVTKPFACVHSLTPVLALREDRITILFGLGAV